MVKKCIDCNCDVSINSLRCKRCHLQNIHKNDNHKLSICPKCSKQMTPGARLCWECYKRDTGEHIDRYKWADNIKENFKDLKKVLDNIF